MTKSVHVGESPFDCLPGRQEPFRSEVNHDESPIESLKVSHSKCVSKTDRASRCIVRSLQELSDHSLPRSTVRTLGSEIIHTHPAIAQEVSANSRTGNLSKKKPTAGLRNAFPPGLVTKCAGDEEAPGRSSNSCCREVEHQHRLGTRTEPSNGRKRVSRMQTICW